MTLDLRPERTHHPSFDVSIGYLASKETKKKTKGLTVKLHLPVKFPRCSSKIRFFDLEFQLTTNIPTTKFQCFWLKYGMYRITNCHFCWSILLHCPPPNLDASKIGHLVIHHITRFTCRSMAALQKLEDDLEQKNLYLKVVFHTKKKWLVKKVMLFVASFGIPPAKACFISGAVATQSIHIYTKTQRLYCNQLED